MSTALSVTFYDKNFAGSVGPNCDVTVEKYSHHMIGGPKAATLHAPAGADTWSLMRLLRCPVEIYGGDGKLVWWGWVSRVVAPLGSMMWGMGLDAMYNYVLADYSGSDTDGTTAAVRDEDSITEYGQKEMRLSVSNATTTQATQSCNVYLSEHKYPHQESEFSGGRGEVTIECAGWYDTLAWKYYSDTNTADAEDTTQIASIVTTAGQFLSGTIVENIANITSSPERDGKSTALACINDLLGAGTNDYRPLLAKVDRERILHVYARKVKPDADNRVDYLMERDGALVTLLGVPVPPWHCTCAAWVQVRDVPHSNESLSAMRPFYIESSEYIVAQDKCTYRPAGAFEQHRLEKYIEAAANGKNGLNGENGLNGLVLAQDMPAATYYGTFNADAIVSETTNGDGIDIYDSASAEWTAHPGCGYVIVAPSAGWYLIEGSATVYQTTSGTLTEGTNYSYVSISVYESFSAPDTFGDAVVTPSYGGAPSIHEAAVAGLTEKNISIHCSYLIWLEVNWAVSLFMKGYGTAPLDYEMRTARLGVIKLSK